MDDDEEEEDHKANGGRSISDYQPRQSRNKRKNFKPRNIVYQYNADDEFGTDEEGFDGHTDGQVPSRSSERGNGSEQPLDLSSDTGPTRWKLNTKAPLDSDNSRMNSGRSPPPIKRFDSCEYDGEDEDDDRGRTPVIDLSRGRDGTGSGSSPGYSAGRANESPHSPRNMCHLDYPPAKRLSRDPPFISADGATMKDYAENTMKELLGMYGLNDSAESGSGHLPIHNFSGGEYNFLIFNSIQYRC